MCLLSLLTLSTSQDKPDSFSISGNVKLTTAEDESLVYNLNQVEFNPLTRQISLKGDAADVFFVGQVARDGKISGAWYSKVYGKLGDAEFQKNRVPPIPGNMAVMKGLKGTYYGVYENTNPSAQLPSKIMLNIVRFHDPGMPGGLGTSGNIRFYFGDYTSAEYIELPFEHAEYNFFTRNLDAKTSGTAILRIEANFDQGVFQGKIHDQALGEVGSFTADLNAPLQ